MGKGLKKKKIKEMRDLNRNIQEEIWYWRESGLAGKIYFQAP
jgi:hypothetical protein